MDKNKLQSDPKVLLTAANRIQRVWRKYIDIQVFKYYKDLVIFHNEGDPALIMKYINPNEAKFIDAASGIHIKFRLAGQQFPPTIYYKIFTHRPIQDICANAPRDYTRPFLKKKTAEIKNNRTKSFPQETTEGWYQRIENNGWRPVSNKHLIQMNMDYYYGVQSKYEPVKFEYSKVARKQDIELKRKKKKIEWMKKMYQTGMLKPKGDSDETNMIIEEAAKNLVDAFEKDGVNSVEDWEVDELLEWTNGLSFEKYVYDWKSLGTTAQSDKIYIEDKPKKPRNYDGAFNSQQSLDYTGNKNGTLNITTPLLASTHRQQNFQLN